MCAYEKSHFYSNSCEKTISSSITSWNQSALGSRYLDRKGNIKLQDNQTYFFVSDQTIFFYEIRYILRII